MRIKRRQFVHMATLAATLPGIGFATAQTALLDQARLLVGFPPGGTTDAAARRVAEGLRDSYARMAIVENKPGASGRLVVDEARRGPTDGSIIVIQPDAVMAQQPHVDPRNTHYKFEDLTPVASIGLIQHALTIGPMVPETVRTMRDFIAWTKANPRLASYGSPGANSSTDFLMRVAMKNNGFEMTHVPYRGSAPGVQDLMGGQVASMISPVGEFLPYLSTGKLRILGTSGSQRSKFTTDVPTFKEQGFEGMELTERFGAWVHAGVPVAVADRLHAAIQKVLVQQSLIEFLGRVGIEADPIPRQVFAQSARSSYDAWAERVRSIGYKPE